MIITWLGASCFRFQDNDRIILVDPFSDSLNIKKMPRMKADILAITNPNHPCCNNLQRITGYRLLLSGPGEIESSGIFLNAIPVNNHDQTIIRINSGGFSIVHLGIIPKPVTDDALFHIEGTDILLIPVGGHDSLTASQAATVIGQVEPRIIIPMYYRLPTMKCELDPLSEFLKEMGIPSSDGQEKLKISKKDLPNEETKVMILNQAFA